MGYTNVDAERFVDFYAAKDWMIGKNRMKDWKDALKEYMADNEPIKASE